MKIESLKWQIINLIFNLYQHPLLPRHRWGFHPRRLPHRQWCYSRSGSTPSPRPLSSEDCPLWTLRTWNECWDATSLRNHLPDRTLKFPHSLPRFTLGASTVLFQLVQGLLGLDHPLCDELFLCQKLVLRSEECFDDGCPCTGLDAAWDRCPGEEKEGNQERGSLIQMCVFLNRKGCFLLNWMLTTVTSYLVIWWEHNGGQPS